MARKAKTNKQIIPAKALGINHAIIDPEALEVIRKLQEHGFAAYIVGGGTRDLLLGKIPKDYDIVTNAVPEKIRKIFGRNSMVIGRRFKIVHVYFNRLNPERSAKIGKPCYQRHIIEVSTYRSNKVHEHTLSEHGRILVDNNYGTMDQDAFRRDFTINALYYDPIAEMVIDYHNGLSDIQNKIIRIIGNAHERYLEDPVRVLRAIRLSEKLGLAIDEDTYINFKNVKNLLVNEPKGRLFEEMLKILLSGSSVSIIKELRELGLPRRVFNLFDKLFFQNRLDEFALEVLKKTDERIATGENVSITYILAGLVWESVYKFYQQELSKGKHFRQALLEAISRNKNLVVNCGITRNLYTSIYEIWLMQLEFDYPNVDRLDHFLNSGRFRQAWHLFNLRHDFQQVDAKIFNWWGRFVALEEDADKTQLLIELVDMMPEEKKTKRRKIKRKRKTTKAKDIVQEV